MSRPLKPVRVAAMKIRVADDARFAGRVDRQRYGCVGFVSIGLDAEPRDGR